MAEITSYEQGVPCWIDAGLADLESAQRFYRELFGWDFIDTGEESGGYLIATLRGKQVAGLGPLQNPEQPSSWTTYFWSDDADGTAKRIADAGGSLLVEPMDVFDQGRMLMAADSTGAVFGVWQGRTHRGSGLANEHGTFSWNELSTPDSDVAAEFYRNVFDYTYDPVQGMDYRVFQANGRGVGGIMGSEPAAYWSIYFEVDDVDAAVAIVGANDGKVHMEPQDTPYGRMAAVEDCCGAAFKLIHGQQA